jgi:hypothetical protein
MSLIAHQHIRAADWKIEAWYLAQEIEEMVMKGQGLPTVANKIVIATAPALEQKNINDSEQSKLLP